MPGEGSFTRTPTAPPGSDGEPGTSKPCSCIRGNLRGTTRLTAQHSSAGPLCCCPMMLRTSSTSGSPGSMPSSARSVHQPRGERVQLLLRVPDLAHLEVAPACRSRSRSRARPRGARPRPWVSEQRCRTAPPSATGVGEGHGLETEAGCVNPPSSSPRGYGRPTVADSGFVESTLYAFGRLASS